MLTSRQLHSLAPLNRQSGMATTMVMLLTGVALTATTMGMMYSVRSAQDQQMASHASVAAESKAWEAVELVRSYLDAAEKADLSTMKKDQLLATSVSGLTVMVSEPYNATTGYMGFTVTATAAAKTPAASSSTIDAIYSVGNAGSSTNTLTNIITFSKTLNLTGSIKFVGMQNTKFSVDGDANLSGSVTGLTNLEATGNITMSGGIQVTEVFTNGTLSLSGSASVTKGSALKDITNASGGTQGKLRTNTNVNNSNGTTSEINAIGNVSISGGPTVKLVNSGGTVTCPGQWWGGGSSVNAKATSNCAPTIVSNNVPAATLVPLTPISVARVKIDATDYKSSANYIFEYVGSKIRVTVSGINGITDGVYYLGKFENQPNRGYNDFLCTATNTAGVCTTPSTPAGLRTLCQGYDSQNGCVTYTNGKWTVAGKSLAPGVLWFDGALEMATGRYYNSVISTGNITTSGSHVLLSLNYAGYDFVCNPGSYNADFANMYPIAFCDRTTGRLKSNALGNIAYLSGLYTGSTFSGGIIKIGASSDISGSILAGDTFLTEGSSTVRGYITAAGQGASKDNTWGGSTTIDLTNAPNTYNNTVPSPGSGSATATAVKWTRNL